MDKEVNGFTLCTVRCRTTINHSEVLKAGDDALELFGGTMNVDHLLIYTTKEDDFEEGYSGHL